MPAAVGGFVRHKLWKHPYRHMRRFSSDVSFEQLANGGWEVATKRGMSVTTLPMREWIGPVERPVTLLLGGPSARQFPLEDAFAAGRLVMAVNGVPAFLAEKGLRAHAWVVADPRMAFQIEANLDHAGDTPLALTTAALAELLDRCPERMTGRRLCIIERVNQWHGIASLTRKEILDLNARSGSPFVFPERIAPQLSKIGWSHRPELGFFSGRTVAFTALQMAVGLGSRDIDVVGLDLCGTGHVYQEEEGALPSQLVNNYQDWILPSFQVMRKALAGTGLVVRNHSPVCPLPVQVFEACGR